MKKKLSVIIMLCTIPFILSGCLITHLFGNVRQTAYGVVDKTVNADNVIYNYEWFKDQYNSYLEMVENYKNAQADVDSFTKTAGDRKDWNYATTNEFSRLNSIVSGYRSSVQSIIKKYNAQSEKVNHAIFKTKDLPELLSTEF
jgi:hypothetical protein